MVYVEGRFFRDFVVVVGEEVLSEIDRKYFKFVDRFEREFVV